MKFFIISLFVLSLTANSVAQELTLNDEVIKSPKLKKYLNRDLDKLNADEETELATFFLLYQLSLKNNKENLFGDDDICLDYNKNKNGKTKISFFVNAKSYETGAASYNYSDPVHKKKYDNLGTVFEIMDQFFQNSNSAPAVTVLGFADAQFNQQKKYTQRSKGMINQSIEDLNTVSKVNNSLLAQDRSENFSKQPFFPKSWSNKKNLSYHSPDGEEKLSTSRRE